MKTYLSLTAILVLAIHLVVNAQTPATKTILAPLSVRAAEKTKVASDAKTKTKALENINKEIAKLKQQLAELQEIKAELYNNLDSISLAEDVETPLAKEPLAESTVIKQANTYMALKTESEELYSTYQNLYFKAKNTEGTDKEKIMNEYKNALTNYEIKQIVVSELSQQITLNRYTNNKNIIKTMLVKCIDRVVVVQLVTKLEKEADMAMRLASEIREEANAQPNNSAKLGAYGNAEEKEELALAKQDEAIKVLSKTVFNTYLYSQNLTLNYILDTK